VLSLRERIDLLEHDILATPPRVTVYGDLPFAILRYEPEAEWDIRREARLLAIRLEQMGKRVHQISMAEMLWDAVDQTEGMAAVVELKAQRGFDAAQEQITTYLSDPDYRPLPVMLAKKLEKFDPATDIVFLTRAAAMAPAIYHMSKLLDEMQGRTKVTTILFYPGSLEGTTGLRFMGLQDGEALGNYRVKIYG